VKSALCVLKFVLMLILMSVSMLCSAAYAAPCPTGQAKDESALVQIEQTWARALEQRDVTTLGCILAQEFEDADPDGMLTDRAATLAKAAEHPPVHHDLSELHAHVQGDSGYIRGLASAVDAQGKILFKVRFTDVYAYRDGRWQCIAGHESMVKGH
jgi:ketosteroid isomerase-like protein